MLLDSFLAYLSRDERALVVHALNGSLEDEVIDLLEVIPQPQDVAWRKCHILL